MVSKLIVYRECGNFAKLPHLRENINNKILLNDLIQNICQINIRGTKFISNIIRVQ